MSKKSNKQKQNEQTAKILSYKAKLIGDLALELADGNSEKAQILLEVTTLTFNTLRNHENDTFSAEQHEEIRNYKFE